MKNVLKKGAVSECPGEAECSLVKEITLLRERCLELEELCFIDALTGLYNFKYMKKALEMEMERTRRTRLPTGLIMADLDHFKTINDTYGHEFGNVALSLVGRVLKESIRVIDVACRYGGEEFTIILPGASLRESIRVAGRMSENIRYSPVVFDKESVTLTASFGVTVFQFSDEYTPEDFLKKADNLLYEAKNLGRNAICSDTIGPAYQPDEVTVDEKALLFSPSETK